MKIEDNYFSRDEKELFRLPCRLRIEPKIPELPLEIAVQLYRIAQESVSNAIKHGRGDIELAFTVRDSCARLEVRDSGPGFPAGFDAERGANTGLELVEMVARWDLQGETCYENRPEGGARVVAEFPV